MLNQNCMKHSLKKSADSVKELALFLIDHVRNVTTINSG